MTRPVDGPFGARLGPGRAWHNGSGSPRCLVSIRCGSREPVSQAPAPTGATPATSARTRRRRLAVDADGARAVGCRRFPAGPGELAPPAWPVSHQHGPLPPSPAAVWVRGGARTPGRVSPRSAPTGPVGPPRGSVTRMARPALVEPGCRRPLPSVLAGQPRSWVRCRGWPRQGVMAAPAAGGTSLSTSVQRCNRRPSPTDNPGSPSSSTSIGRRGRHR